MIATPRNPEEMPEFSQALAVKEMANGWLLLSAHDRTGGIDTAEDMLEGGINPGRRHEAFGH